MENERCALRVLLGCLHFYLGGAETKNYSFQVARSGAHSRIVPIAPSAGGQESKKNHRMMRVGAAQQCLIV